MIRSATDTDRAAVAEASLDAPAAVDQNATAKDGILEDASKGNVFMEEVLSGVQKAFHAAFDLDPQSISLDTQPSDVPAWDSMGHVSLASSLEREFNISFDVDELMAMENVREIVRIVASKVAPSA